MFQNYLKIAWRNLWRNKTFTAINILGLAIGINACLIIYLIVSHELSFDTFHQDKERIYRVNSHITIAEKVYKNSGVSAPLPAAVKAEFTGLETVSAFHLFRFRHIWINNPANSNFKRDFLAEDSESDKRVSAIVADGAFFQIFPHKWLAGNPQIALKEPFQVVLTSEKAKKYFGDTSPEKFIGRTLTYADFGDTVTVKVSGIVETWQQNSDFKYQDFISLSTLKKTNWAKNIGLDAWNNTNSSSQMFVKLNKGIQPKQIEAKFPALIRKYVKEKEDAEGRTFYLQPLSNIHFNAEYGGDGIKLAHLPTLYGLMGIAGFLLLIAAINFINLATAQSGQRAKEIGVRKVLGSTRPNLISQFLIEAFLLAILATILSLIIAEPMLWFFSDFIAKEVQYKLFEPGIFVFLFGIITLTTLLSGFYPAWILASLLPVSSLKNQTSQRGTRKANLRKGLIVFQFAFSQVFIIGTIVVSSQIQFLLNKDMGFNKDAIISLRTPWYDESNKKIVLLEKLKQISEVKLSSLSYSTPADFGHSTTTLTYKKAGKQDLELNVHRKSADENYLKLYEIKLLAGRNVQKSDTIRELLINETYAKQLGFRQPAEALGQFLWMGLNGRDKLPIVGVFADFNVQSLHQKVEPTFIACENKYNNTINLKLHTKDKKVADFQSIVKKVEKDWKEIFPHDKFEYHFLEDKIAKFYENEQKTARLLSIATAVAIFISCIGLFGLVTFSVAQRTKEIGIRKVLGASVQQITALLSYDFVKLVLISILIATPIAYYFSQQWLTDFAYRMNLSWWIFVGAAVISILITLLTVSFRAIRAALKNPVEALRYE